MMLTVGSAAAGVALCSHAKPHSSGPRRASHHAISASPGSRHQPIRAHAVRQPSLTTIAPMIGNAVMKPRLKATEKIPIARFNRPRNHWPTIVTLTTESAL